MGSLTGGGLALLSSSLSEIIGSEDLCEDRGLRT